MREGVESPEQRATRGSQRDRGERGRRRIEHAIDHDRRRLDFGVAVRGKVAGVIDPRDLQAPDVTAIDLIERASGDSWYLLVSYQSLAVQHHRQHASHERDVVRLPLTRLSRGGLARRQKAVDRAEVILNRFERVAILDLDLVSSTKVNATVPFGWIAKLDMQLEIVERLASDEVGAGTRVCEYAIHGTPVCSRRLPARHVRAVEESDRRPPARRRRAAQ